MEKNTTEKKPLPGTVTKAEIRAMFPGASYNTIKRYINEAIITVNNLPDDAVITQRELTRKEWEHFLDSYGYPVGYENFFR